MSIDLFTTFAERVRMRVDEVEANQGCPYPLSANERQLLGILKAHVGRENAIPIDRICERMRIADREVKDIVQGLRLNFKLQIGASRSGTGGGYYLGRTQEEMVESSSQMLNQAFTMIRVVAAIRGHSDATEFLGQLRQELLKKEVPNVV